jgi:uncharacterized membrane protein YfcA
MYRVDGCREDEPGVCPAPADDVRQISDAAWLERARQQRADALKALVRRLFALPVRARVLLTGAATTGASIGLIAAYVALLSYEGVPASAPALAAVLLASTVSSVVGFAFSAVSGAMLLRLISDPVQVVEIMMVCSIAIQSFSVLLLWRDIDWRRLVPFVLGGIVGLPMGVWILLHLPQAWFKETIGVLLTAYAAYALLKRPVVLRINSVVADACVGFTGGITGGLAAFPGAAVTIWCGTKGWDKRQQRGINQPFILIMQVLALWLIVTMRGSIHLGFDFDALEFVPAALLGTWFGLAIFKRLSDQSFTRLVNMLLLVSGVGFMV